jgi:hypothetical protein
MGLRVDFPTTKHRPFEEFEKAVDIPEPKLAKPIALPVDRGQDIFLFVWAVVVGMCISRDDGR